MKPLLIIVLSWIQCLNLSGEAGLPESPERANPERKAWAIFEKINTAAADGSGRLEWETWPRMQAVYADPSAMPSWEQAVGDVRFHTFIKMRREKFKEIRLNRVSFDYISDNDLYFIEGQMEIHRRGEVIVFPDGSCHVTALWQLIAEKDAGNYHSVEVVCPRWGVQVWGMAAMHIAIKESGRWLWTTWEHRSNPNLKADALASNYFPQALVGSVWQNYLLVGTQSDFTDREGSPTLLGNSELEIGFEPNTSSCITCHARATVSDRPGDLRLPVFEFHAPRKGSVGAPDPAWFREDVGDSGRLPEQKYTPTDFVWSLKRAASRQSTRDD